MYSDAVTKLVRKMSVRSSKYHNIHWVAFIVTVL